jgi:hypothetical protein
LFFSAETEFHKNRHLLRHLVNFQRVVRVFFRPENVQVFSINFMTCIHYVFLYICTIGEPIPMYILGVAKNC